MNTDFGQLTDAQKRIWAAEWWQAGRDQSFWFSKGFVGKNENDHTRPIHRVTSLTETERGVECVMQLVEDMSSDGVVGDNELDGNEEALINDTQIIRIDQLRNGVRSKGEMAEQKTVIRFRATAKDKLTFWLPNKIDEMCFLTASGVAYTNNVDLSVRGTSQLPQISFAADVVAPSSSRIKYAGGASSTGTLDATNSKMSWNFIVQAKAFAARKRIRPIRDGGKDYYAIVMSTENERDLLQDTNYQTIVARAAERGSKNPLFTSAMAVVQGVVLHSHNKVVTTFGLTDTNKWGSGGHVDGSQSLLLGADALGLATIGNSFMRESRLRDYENRPGIAVGRKFGLLKPQFKSIYDSNTRQDFGVVSLYTASAQ